ncbi:WD40 repeat domain-containing protein [Agrobacterium radiobacter]|uniref:WD40 repeat domain-containing protein n=1 Tax=Agrobacterium radiobacter TaxID=362 RepID=UPI003F83682E
MQHFGPISGVANHNTGYVATAGYDNQTILWDVKSKRPLARVWHDHLVNQCEFSPDGRLLVTASSDHSARVWSVPEMRLRLVLTGHSDDVSKAAFSPSGNRIATCSYDCTLNVYDLDGKLLHRFVGHSGLIESFDWSRDSATLISCGTDGTIRTWDAVEGGEISCREAGDVDLDALVTVSDGSFIVGNNDGDIIGIAKDGSQKSIKGHISGVKRLVINSAEDKLLSLGYDQNAVLWERATSGELVELGRSKYPAIVWARSAAFIDDQTVVFATFGSSYAIWHVTTGEWDLDGIEPSLSQNSVMVKDGSVYSIGDSGQLKQDGKVIGGPGTLCNFIADIGGFLITGGQTGAVYDAVSGEPIYQHTAPLNCGLSFERAGVTFAAVGSYSGDIIFFRKEGNSIRYDKTLKVHQNAIKGIASDGIRLFSGCADGELAIFDIAADEIVSKIDHAHEGILNDACRFSEGFATVSRDLTLRLWRGTAPQIIPSRHKFSIKCVAANDAGNLIASGSYGGTVDIYDVEARSWQKIVHRPTAAGISSLTWDPQRSCFLASSYDGHIYQVHPDPVTMH